MTTEAQMLTKKKTAKQLSLQLEDNTSTQASEIKQFFKIPKNGRASKDLIKALRANDTAFIAMLQDMVGAAAANIRLPVEPADPDVSNPSVIVSMYCHNDGSTYILYFDTEKGELEEGLFSYPGMQCEEVD